MSVLALMVHRGFAPWSVATVSMLGGVACLLSAWTVQGLTWGPRELARTLESMAHEDRWHRPIPMVDLDASAALTRELDALRGRLLEALERSQHLLRAAEDADRYKTAFMDSISHELRTPLNTILGFAQILVQEIDGPLTEEQREDLRIMQTSGQYLLNLFNDVLELSAMASGKLTLKRTAVDVRALVLNTAKMLEGQRRTRPVSIVVDVPPGLPPLDGDQRRLRRILINLASNALKFTEKGSVTLAARAQDRSVVLSVRDTGIGIAANEAGRIFEEFEQVGDVAKRQAGSGLGLAICRRLTELHGGSIHLRSELGKGSEFQVTLPAWVEEEAADG
ncbi:MAG: ATP-binding protein [Proteobacteria bacterium]|nr:ATP-binding protein [Pseudomonadota bacterium]